MPFSRPPDIAALPEIQHFNGIQAQPSRQFVHRTRNRIGQSGQHAKLKLTFRSRALPWGAAFVNSSNIPESFNKLFMPNQDKKKILAVVDDLLFTVKIIDAAKRVGLDTEFLKSEKDVLEKAKEKPLLIILDLNSNSVSPLKLIAKLKGNGDYKGISLIGFLSHVQGELKLKAQEAGANIVMARSAFSQNLQQILKRHAGVI